jgi:hypothetical protein
MRKLVAEDGHEATTEHHPHINSDELTGALHTGGHNISPFLLVRKTALTYIFYVGGNHFFGRLRFGGRGKGSYVAGFVRGGVLGKHRNVVST